MRIGGIQPSGFLEVSAMRIVTAATCLTLLATLGFGPRAFAQNTNSGEIRGIVTDQSGAIVPGVTITILNMDTGVATSLTTNESGVYDAVSIIPGNYRLTFAKDGFEKLIRSGVELRASTISIDGQLHVGTAQTEVQVTEQAPLLKTETAEQATSLDAKTMQQLPNVGQSWGNFTRILPGAAGSGTGVAVNGNLPYYSNFLADGANTTLPHSANVDVMVFEDIAEVQMSTSTFSAQYGVGGAVFNQISKSGSNAFHGSLYEYLQNNFFNARNTFSSSVPVLRYHNFGGAIGGPVLKNRAFFFFNVDKIINNTTSFYSNSYPTSDQRAGVFSGIPNAPTIYDPNTLGQGADSKRLPFAGNSLPASRLDPLALSFQTLYPTPNRSGYTNNWVGTLPSPSPFLKYFGRFDYNLSDKNRLTLSVTQRDNPGASLTPDAPLDQTKSDIVSYNAQISDVWTVTSNTVNEFRLGFTRQANNFAPATLGLGLPAKLGWNYNVADIAPSIAITGTCCKTVAPGTNAIYNENSLDPSDVVTLIRGKHILKFGGEVLMYQDNATPWGNINAGSFTFSGVFTQRGPNDQTNGPTGQSGIGYADFLLGQVDKWSASNTPIVGFRQKSPQFFVQDDFKVTPTLTVNLGLRYQIQGGWSEIHNRLGDFDPTLINPATNTLGAIWFGGNNGRTNLEATDYKIFLPRVGFAWAPKSSWVFRGGFGIYSYNWSIDTYSGGSEGLGTNSQGSLAQTNQTNPVFILSQATLGSLNYKGPSNNPAVYNGQNVGYVPYHTPVARNYQYSFSIQHQLGAGMVVQAAYVGSHATNLSFPTDLNQVPANLLAQSAADTSKSQSLRPYPQYLTINANLFNARSNYNSAQLTVTKRLSQGLQFDVNYTWSRMLDDQDSSGWGSRDGGQVYQNAHDPRANYASSNFDIPHMFKGDLTYQLPFGKGRTFMNRGGVLDAVLGGWQASTLFVLETGRPYTVSVGTADGSASLAGNGYKWYPNLVGDPSVANPSVAQWFNPAAFAVPTKGTFGNSGRNTLRGPGIEDVDFSIGKNFRIPLPRESGNLQIRFDALNVLNHPNYDIPNAGIGVANAGTITAITGNYSSDTNGFGPRKLQLGARFSF
jgi:hypothetical protein